MAALQGRAVQRPTRGVLSSFDGRVRDEALRLKRQPPHWGQDVLWLKMGERASLRGQRLPSRSPGAA